MRLSEGLECSAAYFKCLTHQEDGLELEEFGNQSFYYSIMFGLEICGSTNKVDFVLSHKNPQSGKYVQHHLKYPPAVPSDKLSHVYTAILMPNNNLVIMIDGKHKKHANFLNEHEFEPPIVSGKKISDPNDKKPKDWDERAKILDPEAVKTNEGDKKTDDPNPLNPKDMNDEENGGSERPKVKTGNSAHREKGHALLIDNPYYNGTLEAKQILNPDYYELDRPEYRPTRAIGIEIWMTNDTGIWLNDILIATSQEEAETYREKIRKPKFETDTENEKAKESPGGEEKLHSYWEKLVDLISKCNYKMNLTRDQHDGWKHANKYEVGRERNKPFSLKSGMVVLQFEIRLIRDWSAVLHTLNALHIKRMDGN